MRRAALLSLVAFAAAVIFFVATQKNIVAAPLSVSHNAPETVALDGKTIHVTIADTESARERGLGGRAELAPDEGMLFVFPSDGNYAFWMKDMSFPIDIIWLAADGTIVHIEQAVSPATYPETFAPETPARYVLELPAGYAKAYTVKVGDKAAL